MVLAAVVNTKLHLTDKTARGETCDYGKSVKLV